MNATRNIVTHHSTGEAGDWSASYEAARTVNGFVVEYTGRGLSLFYRPQPNADFGRFIGQAQACADASTEQLLEALDSLLSDGRCEYCAWPVRTGYVSESDQRTPLCHHVGAA